MENTTEKLNAANREIRHLQEMVSTLRMELEKLHHEKDLCAQRAATEAKIENQHLKDTIAALRSELEKLRFESDEQAARATHSSHDEINQLRATITVLRDELETLHHRNAKEGRTTSTGNTTMDPHHAR